MEKKETGNPRYLLLVEPDPNALNSLRDALSRADFVVRTASSGWEAVKRLKDGPVDLVVSEWILSDMEGSVLREKCILLPQLRDIPFLFLVDENQTDLQVRALRSGVDDCIAKPVDPIVLVARVQAVIQRRETYERLVRVDPLTRLLNRLTLEAEVNQELERLSRYNRVACMVLLDIDEFGALSERKNYALGDLLLTCLAGLILSQIRGIDIAGRYHGEKFLLFLPETESEGAQVFTTRLQAQLAGIAKSVAGENLTFSAGIASAPRDGAEFGLLAQRAEAALRAARAEKPGGFMLWHEGLVHDDAT